MITSCCASEGQTDGTRDNAAVWLCDAGSHQTIGYSQDTGHKIIFIDIHWNNWVFVNNTQAYTYRMHIILKAKVICPGLEKFTPTFPPERHIGCDSEVREDCEVWSVMKLEIMNVMNEETFRSDMSRSHAVTLPSELKTMQQRGQRASLELR